MRAVIVAGMLLVSAGLAVAQVAQDDKDNPDKVSNDQPGRPIQMPAASSETREAFDDFERFGRRGSWERATKALYSIPEAQAGRFVDGKDGFIIPVALKRRAVLSAMPPEGVAAFRLFYDTDAKKMLDQAEGSAEQATLEKLFSAYFLSSVGDNAADRLGDLYFEQGQFDRAADCWLAIVRERPDSELSPALLTVKAALGLARAGRRSEIEGLRGELKDRLGDEVVTIAGRKAKAIEHLDKALADLGATTAATPGESGPSPDIDDAVEPAWRMDFAASVTAGMTPLELEQWEKNSLSHAVPAVAIEGTTLYANYLGSIFALDMTTGKMRWRSGSFHNLDVYAGGDQARMVDSSRYAIVAAPDAVWDLGRDLRDSNYQASSILTCRRPETGEVIWKSPDLPGLAGVALQGTPLLARGNLYLAGKAASSTNQDIGMKQVVVAIRPHDGKLLWKAEVGTVREAQRYYYYNAADTTPQPRLAYRNGSIYIDTHAGLLVRLDAESGGLDWGYGYPTELVQSQPRFFVFFGGRGQEQEPATVGGPPLLVGDAVLVKGAKSGQICAIDPDRMKKLWDRPIAKSARIIGLDDKMLYLGGPDLGALDRKTRTLLWSTFLPGGSGESRVLVRPDGLWQLTPRGIFAVDPATGRVRGIFRGDDLGASGGDLLLTDRWLMAISNRTITAYPRGAAVAAGDAEATKTTRGSDD